MVPSGKVQNIRVFSLLTSLSGDFSGSVHKTAKHLLTLTIKGHYEFSLYCLLALFKLVHQKEQDLEDIMSSVCIVMNMLPSRSVCSGSGVLATCWRSITVV
jgi:hypothetical protein